MGMSKPYNIRLPFFMPAGRFRKGKKARKNIITVKGDFTPMFQTPRQTKLYHRYIQWVLTYIH